MKIKAGNFRNNEIKKILILRLDHLGDLMLTAPMLKSLKAGFPNAELTILIGEWNRKLMEANPLVDRVEIFNSFWTARKNANVKESLYALYKLRKAKFDLIISLRGEPHERLLAYFIGAPVRIGFDFGLGKIFLNRLVKSDMKKHIIDRYLDIAKNLNCHVIDRDLLKMHITHDDIVFAKNLLGSEFFQEGALSVVIAPGAGQSLKLWDNRKFAVVADQLIRNDQKIRVVIVGASNERYLGDEIVSFSAYKPPFILNLIGKTNITQLAAIISLSSFVICLDSAPMHIAVSLGVPLIALFGPTKKNQWGPHPLAGSANRIISKDLDCSGCVKPRCLVNKCMQLISEEEVLNETSKLIKEQGAGLLR